MDNDRGARDEELAEGKGGRHLEVGGDGHGGPEVAGRPGGTAGAGKADADGHSDGRVSVPVGGREHARGPQGRGSRRRRRGKRRSWWIELPILFLFALILALLIKTFVVQAFFIPSSSMENTLKIGDKVLVNKLIYDFRPIHRGDIVVFNGDGSWNRVPAKPKPLLTRLWDSVTGLFGTAPGVHDYIKRVIGIPGDHVVCCNARGDITVNGVALHEKSYLYPGNVPSQIRFNITVPPGRLWVMGDHRAVSYDSRGHTNDPGHGTVPESKVVGRAFMIIAPFSRWRILPIPATFEQPKLNASNPAATALPAPGGLPLPVGLAGLSALPGPVLPATPLVLGLTGAFPLTLLERRMRRRLGRLWPRRRPRFHRPPGRPAGLRGPRRRRSG